MNPSFQENLIHLRNISHISQSALAEQMGISRQTVSKWETGQSYPELSKIPLLCAILNTTPDSLFSGIPPSPPENVGLTALPSAKVIGQNIKKHRARLGLSQEALSDKINVTRQTVSRWETGAAYPEIDRIIGMLQVFDLCWSDLVISPEDSDEEAPPAPALSEELAEKIADDKTDTSEDVSDSIPEEALDATAEEISENLQISEPVNTQTKPMQAKADNVEKPTERGRSRKVTVAVITAAGLLILTVVAAVIFFPMFRGVDITPIPGDNMTLTECDGSSCQITVPNSTSSLSLYSLFPNIDNGKYYFSTDPEGKSEILSSNISIKSGESAFYLISRSTKRSCYTVTVYRRQVYKISFEGTDKTVEVEEGGILTVPSYISSSVTKENHTFVDWDFDFSTPITEDVYIKAKWEPMVCTLNLFYNNGTIARSIQLPYGSEDLPIPDSRNGNAFVGWYKEPTFDTLVTTVQASEQSLYAKYDCDNYIKKIHYQSCRAGIQGNIDGFCIVSYDFTKGLGNIVRFPSYIENKPVTAISYIASETEEAYIPSTVLDIGAYAAQNCFSLKSVFFEEDSKLELLYCNSFFGCTGLEEISLPKSILGIYDYAFAHCHTLSSITVPGAIGGNFGEFVFLHCESLTTAVLEEGITDVETGMFSECFSLKNVTLPSTLDEIEELAFNECTSLETLKIPSSVNFIDEMAFYGCEALTVIYDGTEAEWRNIYSGDIPVICRDSQ